MQLKLKKKDIDIYYGAEGEDVKSTSNRRTYVMRVATVWMKTRLFVQCKCKKYIEVIVAITNGKNSFRIIGRNSCECGREVNKVAFTFEHMSNYDPYYQRFPDADSRKKAKNLPKGTGRIKSGQRKKFKN